MRWEPVSPDPIRVESVVELGTSPRDYDREGIDLSGVDDLKYLYGELDDVRWLTESAGATYPHLVLEALDALERLAVADTVDLVVYALATPDSQHQILLGGFANSVFPAHPNCYAVTEQGAAGPFSALVLAATELAGSDTTRRALVLVLEQATLPPSDGQVPVPVRDSGTAIVLSKGSAGRKLEAIDVARSDSAAPVVPGDGPLIVGEQVLVSGDGQVFRAAAGTVSTGVWGALATVNNLVECADAPVTIVERDRYLGYACQLRLAAMQHVADEDPVVVHEDVDA